LNICSIVRVILAEVLSSIDVGAEEAGGSGVENGLFSRKRDAYD